MRLRSIFLAAAATGALCAGTARAEVFNEYEAVAGAQGTSFALVLQGNVVSSINVTAMQTDPGVNPFYYVILHQFSGSGTSTVTATFNGTNTVVTFTGTHPILPSYTYSYGTKPHFGIDPTAANGSGPKLTVLSQYWSNNATQTQLPAVSVNAPALGVGTVQYASFFVNVTANGQTVGEWLEVPYTGTAPTFSPQLYTAGNATLSNVGFQLSNTMIPLDNLNFGTDPPPGQVGSTFTPQPSFDAPINNIPEPGSALLAVGLAGLLLQRRRHRVS